MNLIILDSFNIGGIEKRYVSLIEYLIKKDLSKNFLFFVNISCIKDKNKLTFFKNSNNVKIYGFKSIFFRVPILRYFEFKFQLLFSFLNVFLFRKVHFNTTFFIGRKSLRFINIINTDNRIYELVYSGNLNEKVEYFDVFNLTKNHQFHFLCLTESIYTKAKKFIHDNFNSNSTLRYSNISFSNIINYDNKDDIIYNKKKAVSYVSRLDEGKGVNLLIDIIDCTLKKDNSITFNIIGYGKLENSLQISLNKLNNKYKSNIELIKTSQPSIYLKNSLIFLSLQDEENFPSQSVLEAMYFSNYILVTKVGMSELLVKNNNGETIYPDPKLFSQRIIKLTSNIDEVQKKAFNSRLLVDNEYNITTYINYLNSNYTIFN